MHDAFGFPRRTRRIKDVEKVFGVHGLRRTLERGLRHQLVPVVLTHSTLDTGLWTLDFGRWTLGPQTPKHNHVLDRGGTLDCFIRNFQKRHDRATPVSSICRDQQFALCVIDTIAKRLCTESTEHDAVRSTDSRAREHGDRQLRHERHVNGDPVSFFDAE